MDAHPDSIGFDDHTLGAHNKTSLHLKSTNSNIFGLKISKIVSYVHGMGLGYLIQLS